MTRAYIESENTMAIFVDKESFTISKDHPYYVDIKAALVLPGSSVTDEQLKSMINLKETINIYGDGAFKVENGLLVDKDGRVLHSSLVERILKLVRAKQPVRYLLDFLSNLYNNPSRTAVDELYQFLETNELPITDDGHFLAYKAVDKDYKDYHTGTVDNRVGQVIEMPRNDVDDDRRNVCSYGFHAARYRYAQSFLQDGGHLMIVKINPADVVSVPVDYNFSKLRTCKYEVIAEDVTTEDVLKDTSVVKEPKSEASAILEALAKVLSSSQKN